MAFPLPTSRPYHSMRGEGIYGYEVASGVWIAVRVSPGGALHTQDTGLNTNPRRYEKLHGFISSIVVISGANNNLPLWAIGFSGVNPIGGRTSGQDSTIYSFTVENATGGAITAWLEFSGGMAITVPFHLNNNETMEKDWGAGFNIGDQDIYFNASASGVVGQLTGTEE